MNVRADAGQTRVVRQARRDRDCVFFFFFGGGSLSKTQKASVNQ